MNLYWYSYLFYILVLLSYTCTYLMYLWISRPNKLFMSAKDLSAMILISYHGLQNNLQIKTFRLDYTRAYFHSLGWTSPQILFILRFLRWKRCQKFKTTRQILQWSSLWNFFHPLHFAKKSAPPRWRFFNLLLSFEKGSI